jgi:hypothetical protein
MPREDSQWKPGQSACPAKILRPGHQYRWPPGTSGNPRGVTKTQARFRELFVEALAGGGSDDELRARAQELSDLAWKAARAGEPWGFQEIRGQLAPLIAAAQIKVTHEVNDDDGFDLSKLSVEDIEVMERILERAAPLAQIESGEGGEEPPDI